MHSRVKSPPARGTILPALTKLVVEAGVAFGAERAALEAALGDVGDADRIPIARHLAVWEVAMRGTKLPGLPMRVASKAHIGSYGVIGYAIYVGATVRDAILRMARYHDLMTDSGRWVTRDARDAMVLCWDRPGARTLGMRVANEQILGTILTIIEGQIGPVPLIEVRWRHPAPPDIREHERLFRAPIVFGADEDALVIPRSHLDKPSPGHDPMLEQYFVQQVDEAAKRVAGEQGFVTQVARRVLLRLPDGMPTLGVIARDLEMAERTLRRRLDEQQTTFAGLVTALQRDRAEALLATDTPIGQIALTVGFADATSFTRAYRRWTGHAPSRRRAQNA